jgi:hypothetical protein
MNIQNAAETADLEYFGNLWIERTKRQLAAGILHAFCGEQHNAQAGAADIDEFGKIEQDAALAFLDLSQHVFLEGRASGAINAPRRPHLANVIRHDIETRRILKVNHNLPAHSRQDHDTAAAARPPRSCSRASIAREGMKAVAAGLNPMDLKRGVDLAVDAIVVHLKKNSKKVSSNEEIAQIGRISANRFIGEEIAKAMQKVATRA